MTERLDRLAALTFVQAPPGYGKTVAAALWARHRHDRGDAVVWVRCTPDINEPGALTAALTQSFVISGLLPLAEGDSDAHTVPLATALASMGDRRIIVVLDRFGRVTDEGALNAVAGLLGDAVNVHVVAISRMPHPLVDTAADYGVEVDHITAGTLAATADELVSLARSWGFHLTPSTADRLTQMTGGWLELSRRVLGSPSFDERTDPGSGVTGSYIADVVLPSIGEAKTAQHVMRLSLAAPVIRPEHLDVVGTGGRNTARLMRDQGLLDEVIAPDGASYWRFPSLVRSALAEHFTDSQPGEAGRIHRQFAEALYNDGEGIAFDLVLEHARAGKHWQLLGELWLKHALMLLQAYPVQTRRVYDNLPNTAFAAAPILQLAAHEFLASEATAPAQGDRSSLEDIADSLVSHLGHTSGIDEITAAFSAQISARRTQGRLADALAIDERLSKQLQHARRRGVAPVPMRRAWFLLQRAKTLLLVGDSVQAIQTMQRAYSAAKTPETRWIASSAAGHLALLHSTVGDASQVQYWIDLARPVGEIDDELDRQTMLPARIAEALMAVARLDRVESPRAIAQLGTEAQLGELWPFVALAQTSYRLAFGEPVTAYEQLAHLAAVHADEMVDDRLAARLVERCTADALLAMGEANRARRYLDDAAARFRAFSTGRSSEVGAADLPWLRLPSATFALMVGDNEVALRLASAAVWFQDLPPRDRAELLMARACAALRLGAEGTAVESFLRAIMLAEESQTLYPYLVIPEPSLRALAGVAGMVLPDALEAHLAAKGTRFPEHAEFIELSPRERAVLDQMTRHATLAGIAQALTVSTNTVKTQSAAIYAKLGVRDREAAVARAHELGFLPRV
ncbi:helix-turn-helix transcriptional regulator [Okibacterium endophyticum]